MSAEDVRIGIIGTGAIASNMHLPSLCSLDGVKVVAVCDLIAERTAKACEVFGVPKAYTLWNDMLAGEALDAVFVLVEPDRLFRPVLECLRAGKHVFMEKPPGLTVFQAEALMREARQAERLLQVGFNRRYIPAVQEVVKRMREYTTITHVEARFIKCGTAVFSAGGASAFVSDTIHAADLIQWIADSEPEAGALVEGRTEDVVPNSWQGVLRFANGVVGTLRANYQTGGRVHSLELHGPGASAFVDLGFGVAGCSAELLVHKGKSSYSMASTGSAGRDVMHIDGKELAGSDAYHVYYGYREECRSFCECVRQGTRPLADIEDGVKALKLLDFLLARRL